MPSFGTALDAADYLLYGRINRPKKNCSTTVETRILDSETASEIRTKCAEFGIHVHHWYYSHSISRYFALVACQSSRAQHVRTPQRIPPMNKCPLLPPPPSSKRPILSVAHQISSRTVMPLLFLWGPGRAGCRMAMLYMEGKFPKSTTNRDNPHAKKHLWGLASTSHRRRQ